MSCCLELKDLVTSCCEKKKTGLAVYAENPGIILFAYLCALLPLATIYALDFITKDWNSVRNTRRSGKIHLAFSLPPLAVVVFYVHLQRLVEDYKEMATAISAAVLCSVHILRTLWGLVQLQVFKEWNMHALHVLIRMGYRYKEYPADFRADRSSEDQSLISESSLTSESLWRRILIGGVRRVPIFGKIIGYSTAEIQAIAEGTLSLVTKCEHIVDKCMMVNSTLIDNEFSGADLPCKLSFSLLRNASWKKGISITDFLTSRRPEECSVRWISSFLARFGNAWLTDTTRLASVQGAHGSDVEENYDLPKKLIAFIACSVTHTVETESENEKIRTEEVSILSPFHVIISDRFEPWASTLAITKKNYLPFQIRGGCECKVLDFNEYAASIRNCVSAWHRDSLNELDEEAREAVLTMKPSQVACFSKLIEERNPDNAVPHIVQDKLITHGMKTLLWQLGCYPDPFTSTESALEDTLKDILAAIPVPKASLKTELFRGHPMSFDRNILQASVHADNWLALEAGHFPFTCSETQVSTAEARQWGQIFSVQKKMELQRLQAEVARGQGPTVRKLRNIKFLGCVMEAVRSSLAFWLHRLSHDVESETSDQSNITEAPPVSDAEGSDHVNWNPSIPRQCCFVNCSDQLYEALMEADSSIDCNAGTFDRKSLQMRLLWEIQLSLIRADGEGPCSPSLMMLCMLGYPSLRISKVDRNSSRGDVILHVGAMSENALAENEISQSGRSSGHFCDLKYRWLRLDIVEAPQPLHIVFEWNYLSKNADMWIACNEDTEETKFCWQSWKDGFMGRLGAQMEWQSTRLRHTYEQVRQKAAISKLSEGILEYSETGQAHWRGWPPFRIEIAEFEYSVPNLAFENLSPYFHSSSQPPILYDSEESEISDDSALTESECTCGCKEHELFMEAKDFLDKGQEKEALTRLCDCILDHKNSLALDRYVSVALEKVPVNDDLVKRLLEIMWMAVERTCGDQSENACRKVKAYDQETLIDLFGIVFDKSRVDLALYMRAQALLLGCLDKSCIDGRCIEAFEAYVILANSRSYYSLVSHFCLSLCYLRRYCSTGHRPDKEIGTKGASHFCLSLCRLRTHRSAGQQSNKDIENEQYFTVPARITSLAIDIAFVHEKGSLSIREYERVRGPLEVFSATLIPRTDLEALWKSILLWSSNIEYRISPNVNAAFEIYSQAVPHSGKDGYFWTSQETRAMNRLAMMHHRGVGNFPVNLSKAEKLYKRQIREIYGACMSRYKTVHRINAMCNLAVLFWQRGDNWESSLLFKEAIDEFEGLDNEEISDYSSFDNHSSSMNNLAAIMLSGKLIQKQIETAKRLYLRAVEINDNPIAMYNLGVLLKFEDPRPENQEKAETLFSNVADLGVDLQSMPVLAGQLEKAMCLPSAEISRAFPVEVDEIDDCFAFVKIVDSN